MIDVAYIALGSNLGDREQHLARARSAIAALPTTRIVGESSIEETEPLAAIDQPRYLNQMIAIETALAPRELLVHLHAIESSEGRVRRERWGSRTLDLDIVSFEHQTRDDPDLHVPHVELPNRSFWQRELDELRSHDR
jgi:2-amino-4-hydroxy-6-hydroxymethyldihydropteridine diphosphokinase